MFDEAAFDRIVVDVRDHIGDIAVSDFIVSAAGQPELVSTLLGPDAVEDRGVEFFPSCDDQFGEVSFEVPEERYDTGFLRWSDQ